MCEVHQGQRLFNLTQRPDIWAQYFLYVTGEFSLAIRGGPYMTPSFLLEEQQGLDSSDGR